MTPKQRVLQKIPTAYADQHMRIKNWHIFDAIGRRSPAITGGKIFKSPSAAWAEAAKRLAIADLF